MQWAIGIDIGGTKTRVALVSADGVIGDLRVAATPRLAADVIATIDTLIAEVDTQAASAIGVGVPARVDVSSETIFSGGFVDLSGPSLVGRLSRSRGRPVFIDNDASMALLAEARFGAAKGCSNAVLLTIGTGIGGAVLVDGRILRGRATAGQLGHICVNWRGPRCVCGLRGCLETASSGTALRRLITDAELPGDTSIESLLARQDDRARAVVRGWAQPLRAGIDSLVAAFGPERLVLGGGLGAAAVRALADFPAASPWFQCEVAPAALSDNAGVIGAALAGLEARP